MSNNGFSDPGTPDVKTDTTKPVTTKSNKKTIESFDARLRQAQKANEEKTKPAPPRSTALGLAFRMTTDMVVSVAVGTGIGLGLDYWLGTKPWFMIVFFFLGAAAGVMNVIRVADATAKGARVQNAQSLPRIEDDDDD